MTDFPPAIDAERIARWPVVDEDGERVGLIVALYADGESGTLQWAGIDSALVGRHHMVPLAGAFVADGFVQVGYGKDRIEHSPVPDDSAELSHATEEALYDHYGLPWLDEQVGAGHEPDGTAGIATRVLVRRPSLLERFGYA